MKRILSNNIVENVRKQPFNKASFEHIQEAFQEVLTSILKNFTENTSSFFKLHGLVDSNGSPTAYDISAGAVYYNGEVYQVPAFSGSHVTNVPVLTITTAYKTGDPVKFSDNNDFNVHEIKNMVISLAGSGSGTVDYSALQTLGQGWAFGSRIPDGAITTNKIGVEAVTSVEIAANAVGTPELANSSVNTSKIADDAVTNDKIADGQVTKSVDGGQRLTAKFPIPSWDMVTDGSKHVTIDSGINTAKIVGIEVWIIPDDGVGGSPLDSNTGGGSPNGGVQFVTTGDVNLYRKTGGFYDAGSYNDAGVVRGHILVTYEP